MLHGKGIGRYKDGNQDFLTKSYEDNRKKGLRDKEKLTSSERDLYEISGSQGGGKTLETTYEIKQFPFPMDATIRRKKKVDVRKIRPEIGEMSD